MKSLTKFEYKLLNKFYELDEVMTKTECIEQSPELNSNTIIMGISNLHKKGYLEVAKICQNHTSLSRAYRPKLSMNDFYCILLGEQTVERLVEKIIAESTDFGQLEQLLEKVQQKKQKLMEKEKVLT